MTGTVPTFPTRFPCRRRPSRSRDPEPGLAGFALLEVLVALFVATITFLGVVSVVTSVLQSSAATSESLAAGRALRRITEDLKLHPFDRVFVDFSPGGTPGDRFVVPSLEPPAGGEPHGTIEFVGELEALDALGYASDFDIDGDRDSLAPATIEEAQEWVALPVRLQIRWRESATGLERVIESVTVLYNQNR